MTREEAIKLLICEKVCVEDVNENVGGERVRQAYDMAIEALQERSNVQNMHNGNLISKADAIELCAEAQGRASTKLELKGISRIWQGLLKLPSTEVAQGEWIKAKGMMPPEFHGHHCCSKCGNFANMDAPYGNRENLSRFCPTCGVRMKNSVE